MQVFTENRRPHHVESVESLDNYICDFFNIDYNIPKNIITIVLFQHKLLPSVDQDKD